MSFRENQAAQNRRRQVMIDQTDDPLALGFGASVATAFEQFRAEDTTNSESRAVQRFLGARNSTIDQMVADGEIPEDVVDANRSVVGMNQITGMNRTELNYHALAAWANENTGSEFETDDAEMIRTMAWERRTRQRQLANGNMLGEVVGTMAGAMTDPVLLAMTAVTLPLGPEAIPAAGFLRSVVARTALMEGMVGIASEIPIQQDVAEFKHRIDSPYTFEDAVRNVLTTGAGSAVLGGTVALAAQGASRYLLKRSPNEFVEAASTSPGNADTDRLVAELSELPGDSDVDTVGAHLDRMLDTEQRLNQPQVPKIEPIAPEEAVDGWQPADPREWDLEVETESGEVRTLRDLEAEYETQLRAEEEQLDALSACALLPSEVR